MFTVILPSKKKKFWLEVQGIWAWLLAVLYNGQYPNKTHLWSLLIQKVITKSDAKTLTW